MKPLVFFSHSSRDAESILRLKQLLVQRTSGTIDFFLSSDGVSIAAGRPWTDQVFAALSSASLVFAFLSPNSLLSQWVFFEAGVAFQRGTPVVPVGIAGVKVGQLPPPMSLLQGFDMDSAQGLNVLVDTINRAFAYAHSTSFSTIDYNFVVRAADTQAPAIEDGEHRFQVFSVESGRETAHELLQVDVDGTKMTVHAFKTPGWDSFGVLQSGRYVGRFKYPRGNTAEDLGIHDFVWNGSEFVGSAKLDSGRWFAEDLIWRPLE